MYEIHTLSAAEFPAGLQEIPQPPKTLYLRGNLPSAYLPLLTVVGSRRYTSYGAQVISQLIGGLANYQVGIVSGLAIGIDGLAHEAALAANLYTLSIPGSGLGDDVIYPVRHRNLARKILERGGGLLSEYEPNQTANTWTFPQRNRLLAGVSNATLLIEADEKSGTLITARMASDYNKDVMVVPGNIFSINSKGVHQFLKLGAYPVTTSADILDILHIEKTEIKPPQNPQNLSSDEKLLFEKLTEAKSADQLIYDTKLPINTVTTLLMKLELSGHITETDGLYIRTIQS